MTPDPWLYLTAQLLGTYSAPAVRWPADRVRVVVAIDEPERVAAPATGITQAEAEVLAAVTRGLVRPAELAAELGIEVAAVSTRLTRMQSRGLVRREARGIWAPA